jgi:hypothetical protein
MCCQVVGVYARKKMSQVVLFLASTSPAKSPSLNPMKNVLPFKPEPPTISIYHIVDDLLHTCNMIIQWLLQEMTHVTNNKHKIRASVHQVPQAPDDALVCCSVNQ